MRFLHKMNPLRLQFIEKHSQLARRSVLDIGCVAGILSEALAAQALKLQLLILVTTYSLLRRHMQPPKTSELFLKSSAEQLAEKKTQAYDVICCMEMLEHVLTSAIIRAAAHMLHPDGKLFLSTINRSASAFIKAIIGAEYLLRILPHGTHHYEKFIRPSELNMANEHDTALTALAGLNYHPLKQHFTLNQNVSCNYLACFSKPVQLDRSTSGGII